MYEYSSHIPLSVFISPFIYLDSIIFLCSSIVTFAVVVIVIFSSACVVIGINNNPINIILIPVFCFFFNLIIVDVINTKNIIINSIILLYVFGFV